MKERSEQTENEDRKQLRVAEYTPIRNNGQIVAGRLVGWMVSQNPLKNMLISNSFHL
jgi:hypothetical protein